MAATLQAPITPPTPGVSLVDADPELFAGIPADDLLLARRHLVRPRFDIPKGRWAPELLRAHEGAFGFLVVEGAIVREVELAGRECAQILGPGDVVREASLQPLFACPVSWSAPKPSVLTVLDERFTTAAHRWPALSQNLFRRLLEQSERVALHAATAQLPRVERRVVALFWQLAERWGHVTPFGIEVPLELTHEALGRLVGAQRPTVTLALRELAEDGVLTRSADGWLLDRASSGLLESADAPRAVALTR